MTFTAVFGNCWCGRDGLSQQETARTGLPNAGSCSASLRGMRAEHGNMKRSSAACGKGRGPRTTPMGSHQRPQPAALSGSRPKASGSAGGYLLGGQADCELRARCAELNHESRPTDFVPTGGGPKEGHRHQALPQRQMRWNREPLGQFRRQLRHKGQHRFESRHCRR